jgi:hypothetical protein
MAFSKSLNERPDATPFGCFLYLPKVLFFGVCMDSDISIGPLPHNPVFYYGRKKTSKKGKEN